jgi:hypothetical protein
MPQNQFNRLVFLLFPAVAMSLGWALRGFIGGGPLGAMIPGAMVTLSLALLLKLPPGVAARAAAFGAVGIGFGGEMTYGQTVGFAGQAETMWFGLLGLAVKGGIWGFTGGAIVAIGFLRSAFTSRRIVATFALMTVACYLGWRYLNHPKLIYFSNLADRPREEMWFGLFCAGVVLLAAFRHRVVTTFAIYAALGGFLGFGGGGLFISLHRIVMTEAKWFMSWKSMEYSFGFGFGLTLAIATWKFRQLLAAEPDEDVTPPSTPETFATVLFTLFAAVFLSENLRTRFDYLIVGAMLMGMLLAVRWLSWHIALTMTFACFAWDLAENVCLQMQLAPMLGGWFFVAASSLAFFYFLDQRLRKDPPPVRFAFALLLWTSMAVATSKTIAQLMAKPYFAYEYPMFVVATAGTWWLYREVSKKLAESSSEAG